MLLDVVTWDLVKDSLGNIAVADDPYSVAQDVASAARAFQGEVWYDTTQGVPYFAKVLGKPTPLALVKSYYAQVAKTVPEVDSVKVFFGPLGPDRQLTGQIQVKVAGFPTALAVNVAPQSSLPPQIPGFGLSNNGTMLVFTLGGPGYPTSEVGLPPGVLWNNGNAVGVVDGAVPDPLAFAVMFPPITAAQLFVVGGQNLPQADPLNSGQLWNNGGLVFVSSGD